MICHRKPNENKEGHTPLSKKNKIKNTVSKQIENLIEECQNKKPNYCSLAIQNQK